MSKIMILKPKMSEKAYAQSHETNTYSFLVPKSANKLQVAQAVEQQFKVKVEDVRMLVSKGKKARSIRIGGVRKVVLGKRPDVKKAYVRVKEGDSIPIFASIDEAEEKAKKAEAKAAKKSKKEAK
ncbi:MAG TPA: 50S ribosomal protein L23 [Candidatus Saccharimonadales bacterium]|nr:50S ribosomal protein L23 [Candidatus Saccharimonadales bacterium]